MAAHRYWKLTCTANNGLASGYLTLGEIRAAEERNGTNVLQGITVTSSSTAFSSPATNVNDGSRTSFFHSNTTPTPHTITFDFGATAGNWKDCADLRILPRPTQPTGACKDFTWAWSDDNSSYTTTITVTGYTGWVSGIMTAWQAAGCPDGTAGAMFWRWNFTDSDASFAIAGTEAEMHETISGSDVISSTTDFFNASSTGGGAASNLFDNNTATLWSSSATEICTIEIECSQKRSIEEVSWTARTDGGLQTQAPRAFTVDYSYDRRSWTAHISASGSGGWASGETRTFNSTPPAATWVPQAVVLLQS